MSQRSLVHYLAVLSLGFSPILANAAGFRVPLESVGDLGNAFAGGAALTQDASINAYNAAGLSFLHKQQFVAGAVGVLSSSEFKGTVTAPALIPEGLGGIPFSATGKAKSTSNGVIPSFYYSHPVNEKIDLGIGVTTPFGLGLDFGDNSMMRYALVKAQQRSFNIGPSISYLINPQWSIGAGPNFQYYSLSAVVRQNTRTIPLAGGFTDSESKLAAHHWGYGGHIGVLFAPTEATHLGLAYRTKINHDMSGESDFGSGVSPLLTSSNNNFKLKFTAPAILMLSAYHAFSDWAVMGTVDYTYWNAFKNIKLYNVAAVSPGGLPTSVNTVIPQNFKNTWHMALAVNRQLNDHWLFRLGVAHDQNATNNIDRAVEFGNGSLYSINIGTRYQYDPALAIDAAYAHSFIKKTNINHTNATTLASEVGTSQTTGDVFGLALVWTIC
jgi:long-chain fatty acid transport protein